MKPSDGRRPERPSERKPPPRLVARFVAISWRDLAVSFGPILIISAIAIYVAVRLIQPAPPNTQQRTWEYITRCAVRILMI